MFTTIGAALSAASAMKLKLSPVFAELFLDDASAAKTDTRTAATPPAASRAADELRLVEGLLGTVVTPLVRTDTSDGTIRELHRALRDRLELPAKKAALSIRVRGRWKLRRKEGKEAMTAHFLAAGKFLPPELRILTEGISRKGSSCSL